MVQFCFREIDLACEQDRYSQQEVVDIRMLAQVEMLRCRRRATWCRQRMVTLALFWGLLLALFWMFNVVSGLVEASVLLLLGTSVMILHRSAMHSDQAYRYCAEVDRSFSEVCVEHYCEIDELCRQHPTVARYVEQVASAGRVLTYYELSNLPKWAARRHNEKRLRKTLQKMFGTHSSQWLRRQVSPSNS